MSERASEGHPPALSVARSCSEGCLLTLSQPHFTLCPHSTVPRAPLSRCLPAGIFLQHPHLHEVLHALMHPPPGHATDGAGGCASDAVGAGGAGAGHAQGAHGAAAAAGAADAQGGDRHAPGAFRVASIGGGGGSDAVGLILLRNYLQTLGDSVCGEGGGEGRESGIGRPVAVWVCDVEVGWREAVSE